MRPNDSAGYPVGEGVEHVSLGAADPLADEGGHVPVAAVLSQHRRGMPQPGCRCCHSHGCGQAHRRVLHLGAAPVRSDLTPTTNDTTAIRHRTDEFCRRARSDQTYAIENRLETHNDRSLT